MVAAFYYLKLIRRMWFDTATGPYRRARPHRQRDHLRLRRLRLPGRAHRRDLARPRRDPGGQGIGAAVSGVDLTRRSFGDKLPAVAALIAATPALATDETTAFRDIYTSEWAWRQAEFPDDEDPEKPIAPYLPRPIRRARMREWRGGGMFKQSLQHSTFEAVRGRPHQSRGLPQPDRHPRRLAGVPRLRDAVQLRQFVLGAT